jgi:hypothetical protein
MNKDEAKRLLQQEWRKLPLEKRRDTTACMPWYFNIKKTRPDLLSFRCQGDQWQVISGWISTWQAADPALRK